MGRLGVFGDVVFETSDTRILTFTNFNRSGTSRWADHEIIGRKPIREFLGPGLEEIKFSIHLSQHLGVNVNVELNKLRRIRDKGETRGIILGESFISKSLWTLEEIREVHKTYNGKGIIINADVDLTIKEYPRLE